VRRVRNYLEEKGASPLLFHLLALTEPEEFWPIIEKEIAARNFFLYCESEAAAMSEWVRRERAIVAAVAQTKLIRPGTIRVDLPELDFGALDAFLAKTRVFPSYAHRDRDQVRPFLQALEHAGFQVFTEMSIKLGEAFAGRIREELELAARDGWVLVFLSASSLNSVWVQAEISMAHQLGAKLIPIAIERIALPQQLAAIQIFDATVDPVSAPQRLVGELLTRRI
jgi:hypothetical protein